MNAPETDVRGMIRTAGYGIAAGIFVVALYAAPAVVMAVRF